MNTILHCERGLFAAVALTDALDLFAGRLGPALAVSKLAIALGASQHHE